MAYSRKYHPERSPRAQPDSHQQNRATVQYDFPFLSDKKTIDHIRVSKVLFIMRGLSGSGKSTVVEQIKRKYPGAVVCSADDFFLDRRGVYRFDGSRIKEAHDACKKKADEACRSGSNVVIVDNTNVQHWEMDSYFHLAETNGYTTIIVIPQTPWRFDPAELSRRTIHSVPRAALEKKLREFQTVHPRYWGWFLNEEDSRRLQTLAKRFFKECARNFKGFRKYMRNVLDFPDGARLRFEDIYTESPECATNSHCTAYYCSDGLDNVDEYATRNAVQRSLGEAFGLHVIGFVITSKTVGARLALNGRQMLLWNHNDNPTSSAAGRPHSSLVGSMARMSLNDNNRRQNMTDKSTISPAQIAPHNPYESLRERPQFSPTAGPGSKAHITIGVSVGHKPVHTGLDLIEVIELEETSRTRLSEANFNNDIIKYYGEGRCVVYLQEPFEVQGLFSGKYSLSGGDGSKFRWVH